MTSENSNYPDGVNGSEDYFEGRAEIIRDTWEGIEQDIKMLAIAQTLYKQVAGMVKTKDPTNLRGVVDGYFKHLYKMASAVGAPPKSFDINVDGEKVGTYSITPAPAIAEHDEVRYDVNDRDELMRWAMEQGYVLPDMDAINEHIGQTGEVPPGMSARKVHFPSVPAGIGKTSLRIDPEKVKGAVEIDIVAPVIELLDGGLPIE